MSLIDDHKLYENDATDSLPRVRVNSKIVDFDSLITVGIIPKIYNINYPTANVELFQTLSSNTKKFTIKVRGTGTLRLAFYPGETATNYIEVKPHIEFEETNLKYSGSLYFQVDTGSVVVEIREWT